MVEGLEGSWSGIYREHIERIRNMEKIRVEKKNSSSSIDGVMILREGQYRILH